MTPPRTPRVALTIAGSDSSGGAGIQADLKTFHALGVFGTSAITALTAQSTRGVAGIHPVDAAFVRLQIDTTVQDIPPDAVKTGMLADASIVEVLADAAARHRFPVLVVDPVMVATTGARLLEEDAIALVRERLLPIATLVTPNAPEAAVLLDREVVTAADQEAAARALVDELGARAALVKGGDLEGDVLTDVLYDGNRLEAFRDARIRTTSTHGSGCALASAIAAYLALGEGGSAASSGDALVAAVAAARTWVRRAIEDAPRLGHGRGPLDLFTRD
ncbi:MAG TPA: bifunctional hydroxymethylpyrimidine kinase/phosphomethylpyrimidine kinase [Gemmatimonadota bacterium]|nr:bifunctional hydroxymethylpyrimidine kinase/phosphomethylpyrimidine kinase [Gemmatimonadota bacterium]